MEENKTILTDYFNTNDAFFIPIVIRLVQSYFLMPHMKRLLKRIFRIVFLK